MCIHKCGCDILYYIKFGIRLQKYDYTWIRLQSRHFENRTKSDGMGYKVQENESFKNQKKRVQYIATEDNFVGKDLCVLLISEALKEIIRMSQASAFKEETEFLKKVQSSS